MKTNKYVIAIIFLFALFTSLLYPQTSNSKIAFFSKVVNNVEKKSPEKDWAKASKGDMLYSEDQVQTKANSIAIIKFLDNSMLRILPNSKLLMRGIRNKNRENRIDEQGTIGFDVKKLQNQEFTFTSPTSVASIRGTLGLFIRQNEVDILILKSGTVNLKNLKSDKDNDVNAGEIGMSYPDGKLEVRKATPEESNQVDNALKAGNTQIQKELNFELKDSDGNKKELKIKYKE